MLFGCLVLLALFGVWLFFAEAQAQALALPFPWVVSAALALGATLTLGSLQGLWQAWRRRRDAGPEPVELVDGATVRLSGVLRPTGAALKAPFSDRAAVFVEFEATAPEGGNDMTQRRPRWNGRRAAPCDLQTRLRRLSLRGHPSMRECPEQQFSGAAHHPAAARLLATTPWQLAPDIVALDLRAAGADFAAGGAGMNLINREALGRLRMDIGRSSEAELLQRLPEHAWLYRERAVAPEVPVTVIGTYRAAARMLEIGLGPATPEHGLIPGGAVEVAQRQFVQAATFVAVLASATAAAHWVALADGGAVLRRIVSGLELAA